jgi:hypothetical protein
MDKSKSPHGSPFDRPSEEDHNPKMLLEKIKPQYIELVEMCGSGKTRMLQHVQLA